MCSQRRHDAKNAIACLQSCVDMLDENGCSDSSILQLMSEACQELLTLISLIP
jgi:hypothetical protein